MRNRTTGEKFELTKLIGTNWLKIGSTLGLEPDTLDSIMNQHSNNQGRLREVLLTWLDRASGLPHSEDYPLSWQGLGTLLDDSGKEEVASQYFSFLDTF